jgi:hypothetical protein
MAELAHALASTAPRVSEQDIAHYVTRLLGARGAQRRATLKQAARSLGWAVATSDQLPRAYVDGPGGGTPARFTPPPSGLFGPRNEGLHGLTPSHPSQLGGSASHPAYASLPGYASQAGASQAATKKGLGGAGIALVGLAALGGMSLVVIGYFALRPALHPPLSAATTASPTTQATAGARPTEAPAPPTSAPAMSAPPDASATSAAPPPSATASSSASAKKRDAVTVAKPRPSGVPPSTGDVDMGF